MTDEKNFEFLIDILDSFIFHCEMWKEKLFYSSHDNSQMPFDYQFRTQCCGMNFFPLHFARKFEFSFVKYFFIHTQEYKWKNGNLNGIKGEIARGIKDYSGCSCATIDVSIYIYLNCMALTSAAAVSISSLPFLFLALFCFNSTPTFVLSFLGDFLRFFSFNVLIRKK